MAQKEGLWVILRPGPYSCAEWEGGGAPWWLMGDDGGEKPISMRSSDPRWVVPATNWLHAVGRPSLRPRRAAHSRRTLLRCLQVFVTVQMSRPVAWLGVYFVP